MIISQPLCAPILIGTYNRIEHFKKLIASLKLCDLAKFTDIYIAIDYPCCDEVIIENQKIHDYSKKINGFLSVNIITRLENFGPARNFFSAIDYIFLKHDRLILLEDDNIVAKNFLTYMNQGLEFFEDDPKCLSLCGYNFTTEECKDLSPTNVYSAPYLCAWGLGYWRKKYVRCKNIVGNFPDPYFINPFNILKTIRVAHYIFPMYISSILSDKVFPDVEMSVHCIKHDCYNIYPTETKVINMGFDGSGLNCGLNEGLVNKVMGNEAITKFKFRLIDEITLKHLHLNDDYHKNMVPIKFNGYLYAVFSFYLMSIIGRSRYIKLRNFVKKLLLNSN